MNIVDCALTWIEAHPGAAAWVQAFGALLAIAVAIYVPWSQQRRERAGTAADEIRQKKDHLRRLITGLKVEVAGALEAAERQEGVYRRTLAAMEDAEKRGAEIVERGPLAPGAMNMTEGIIYRAVAADLGRLPPNVIEPVVSFYTFAAGIARLTETGSLLQAFKNVLELAPRLRMSGELLIRLLEKFERSDFAVDAKLSPTLEEGRALAMKAGYDLDGLFKEHGINVPGRSDPRS